jgi:hypothetical protein
VQLSYALTGATSRKQQILGTIHTYFTISSCLECCSCAMELHPAGPVLLLVLLWRQNSRAASVRVGSSNLNSRVPHQIRSNHIRKHIDTCLRRETAVSQSGWLLLLPSCRGDANFALKSEPSVLVEPYAVHIGTHGSHFELQNCAASACVLTRLPLTVAAVTWPGRCCQPQAADIQFS